MTASELPEVTLNEAAHRFELHVDGHTAVEVFERMGVDPDVLQGEIMERIDHPHPEGDGPENEPAQSGSRKESGMPMIRAV